MDITELLKKIENLAKEAQSKDCIETLKDITLISSYMGVLTTKVKEDVRSKINGK